MITKIPLMSTVLKGTSCTYEAGTIHGSFALQAKATPDHPALSFEGTTLSYSELDHLSDQVAFWLIGHGCVAGAPVSIITDKCVEFVVGCLGTFKAGGFYVPIDPEYPEERMALMLRSCGADHVLTHKPCLEISQQLAAMVGFKHTLCLDESFDSTSDSASFITLPKRQGSVYPKQPAPIYNIYKRDEPAPTFSFPERQGSDPAYMIFTSGTSGVPKGVLNCHRSVVNLTLYYQNVFKINAKDTVSQLPSLSFDASIGEIFPALLLGAHVRIFPSLKSLDPASVVRGCIEHQITFSTLSPTYMKLILSVIDSSQATQWDSLRMVILGGEALPYETVHKWQGLFGKRVELVNIYGPTEATVFSTAYFIAHEEDNADRTVVPIGRPLINESVVIRNQAGEPCKPGEPGELCIGGDGLALGYHGDDEMTDNAFVLFGDAEQTMRIYHTGDKVFLNESGDIEFLGRLTDQVKIKGYRVELQEVISYLLGHAGVRDAFAQALKDPSGTDTLIAWYVSDNAVETNPSVLRDFMSKSLPDFMIPARFILVEPELPYTTSGKVDKPQLPLPEWEKGVRDTPYEEPATDNERMVSDVWSRVLKIKYVGRLDHFFFMGGDSISALRSVSMLNHRGYSTKTSQLMGFPTVHEFASRLGKPKALVRTGGHKRVSGDVLLTPVQKWFFSLNLQNPAYHHQSLELETKDSLVSQHVVDAMTRLMEHHDLLRSRFEISDQGVRQVIEEQVPPIEIERHNLQELDENLLSTKLAELGESLRRAIRLDQAPLIKLALLDLPQGATRLIWVVHHAIVDTVSWHILGDDFLDLYNGLLQGDSVALLPKTTSFKDWSAWQSARDNVHVVLADALALLQSWQPALDACAKNFKLPAAEGVTLTAQDIQRLRFSMDAATTRSLLEVAIRTYNTTVEDLILVAFYRALAAWTQHEHILIDVEWHGRESLPDEGIDLSRTVGWFTAIHPLYRQMLPQRSIREDIIDLKEQRRAIGEQGVRFNQMRYLSQIPEIRAAFQDYKDPEVVFNFSGLINDSVGDWRIVPIMAMENGPENANPYEMAVETFIKEGQLYNDIYTGFDLVPEAEVTRLGNLWQHEMKAVIEFCAQAPAEKTPADFDGATLSFEEVALLPEGTLDAFPLSQLQSAMFFHSQTYLIQVVYRIERGFDEHHLREALHLLVERHPALRTVICNEGMENPLQVVLSQVPVLFEFEDIRTLSEEEQASFTKDFLRSDREHPFDLTQPPLFRSQALVRDDQHFDLVLTVHHFMHDGWSLTILMREFMAIYTGLLADEKAQLQPVRGSFKEFVRFQQTMLAREEVRTYWRELFSGLELPQLPRDFSTPTPEAAENHIIFELLDANLCDRLRQFAARRGLTVNDLFLACYTALLHFVTQSERVILGIITSGRGSGLMDYESIVGCCVNTLPFTLEVARDKTYHQLACQTHETVTELGDYLSFPLAEIIEIAKPADQTGAFELFETLYNFEVHQYVDDHAPDSLPIIVDGFDNSAYPITISLIERPDDFAYKVTYLPTALKRETVERWIGWFKNILNGSLDQPDQPLGQIPWLGEDERETLLETFNDTYLDYPRDKTLHQAIEERARQGGDRLAITFKDIKLTYRELNDQANRLAHRLKELGAAPNQLIGLMVDRTHNMVISILAVLKSGAAYVPIDPTYPENRIEYMLDHSKASIVVMQTALHVVGNVSDANRERGRIDFRGHVVSLDQPDAFAGSKENLISTSCSSDLAYIIYTSGSTGKPKGVMIEHRNAMNFIASMNAVYDFDEDSRFLALTTICFDQSVMELILPFVNGMQIVIADEAEQMDPHRLNSLIAREKVDMLAATPARMRLIVNEQASHFDDFTRIRKLQVAGEAFPDELLSDLWHTTDADIYNAYGPTETTISATIKKIPHGGTIDIGKPVANTQIYILDKFRDLVPIGLSGEIWIGGESVGRGYLFRDDLTSERFIENPFRPGERIYATGDLGRFREDGNLECLGRIDFQVKVRGFRVELGEIEASILAYPAIKEVTAMTRVLDGVQTLCAYVVAEEKIELSSLRSFLDDELPYYMVPTYLTVMDAFPLSPSGKINRDALPDPTVDTEADTCVAPVTEYEERLLAIWTKLLDVEQISTDASFFDLGGHSLKAIRLISRVNKSFGSKLSFSNVFNYPTIQLMANCLTETEAEAPRPIVNVPDADHYPCSYQQQRMYAIQAFDPQSIVYNMPAAFELEGQIDASRIEAALAAVVERHEAFRTHFTNRNGQTMQIIDPQVTFRLERIQAANEEEALALFIRAFDLHSAPLLRGALYSISDHKHLFLLDMHHIISDGASTIILAHDFVRAYHEEPLSNATFQYKDYAVWQRDDHYKRVLAQQEKYWVKQYETLPMVLDMPTDWTRPAVQSNQGQRFSFGVGAGLGTRLNELAQAHDATLYMCVLAAFNLLLAHYSGQDDVVIGSPVAGRGQAEIEEVIGLFVNTVALRSAPSAEKPFSTFLTEVRKTALDGYANQNYPIEELIEKIKLPRDISRNPLFDVICVQENQQGNPIHLADVHVHNKELPLQVSRVDLLLSYREEKKGQLRFGIEYCERLFKDSTMRRLARHFTHLLENICKDAQQPLGKITMITPAETDQILHHFNQPNSPMKQPANLGLMLEAQVARTPRASAIELDDDLLSFAEFNEKANRLAHLLRSLGAGPDVPVGLACNRSLEMVIGMYAILKSGSYYVPIDQEWATERAETVINETGMKLALVETEQARDLIKGASAGLCQLFIEGISQADAIPASEAGPFALSDQAAENPIPLAEPNNLAYIIFTSGTTGKPKGVLTTHQSVVNLVCFMKGYFYEAGERSSQIASYTFDGSVIELAGAMPSGATLCLCPSAPTMDGVVKYMVKQRLTNLLISPSYLKQVITFFGAHHVAELYHLRKVFSGGEALGTGLVKELQERFGGRLHIINVYGPTESTVFSTSCVLQHDDLATMHDIARIGGPVLNAQVYLLDGNKQLCPVGLEGEIYIGGVGVARGYLNDPSLSALKFISSPYDEGQRLYRTGDIGKWHENGTIEILGRKDDQVKVRGFRIELGEIEATIAMHGCVQEVVAAVRDLHGEQALVAYMVLSEDMNLSSLRSWLKGKLPDYMLPASYVIMDAFPLNQSSKVDRSALPMPTESLVDHVSPRNDTEQVLAEIWEEVLGVHCIGVDHNFFDQGGHSLNAMSVAALVSRHFSVELPIKQLFMAPTIAELAALLPSLSKDSMAEIVPLEKAAYYPASSQQRRMVALQRLDTSGTTYNMPSAFHIYWKPEPELIEAAFNAVIAHHESFRTSFKIVDGEPVQVVSDHVTLQLKQTRAPGADPEALIKAFIQPFDLGEAPLLRVELVRLGKHEHILLMDMHHIVADGSSMIVLAADLAAAYEGRHLSISSVSYRDFAGWQLSDNGRAVFKHQEAYWLSQLGGDLPVLELPTDRPRPALQQFDGAHHYFELAPDCVRSLYVLARDQDVTPFMLLVAASKALLARISGQDEILAATPVAGRDRAEIVNVIGMFVNTLVLRTAPAHDKTFADYLAELKLITLEAFQNQGYPFEELLHKLALNRDLSRNPLFDVLISLQRLEGNSLHLGTQSAPFLTVDSGIAKVDLSFNFFQKGDDALECQIDYATCLFDKEHIEQLANQLQFILDQALIEPYKTIGSYQLATDEERAKILEVFNDSGTDFGAPQTMDSLFRASAARRPDRPALILASETLSFRELDQRSNKLARKLRNRYQVGPDTVVPIVFERSFNMMIAIFGILKAGGAYLPISPENPQDRTYFIVEDAAATVILTESKLIQDYAFTIKRVDLDRLDLEGVEEPPEPLHGPHNLAYVIYTSGSTGKPKGVMLEHRNAFNTFSAMEARYPMAEGDSWLFKTIYTFDHSVIEVFGWLLGQGHLVLLPPGQDKDPHLIGLALRQHKVTHINFVPSMLKLFVASMTEELRACMSVLKHIHLCGEVFTLSLHRSLLALDLPARIDNIYGPTEAAIYATWYPTSTYEGQRSLPIGCPLPNATAYILDRNENLMPMGVPGELVIGGAGVARGYLNRPELTDEKFSIDPFKTEQRIYRTGDLAARLPGGHLEFLGRLDHQVKVRGYRIELGEIETHLNEHPLVHESVLIVRQDEEGTSFLCAYVVGSIALTATAMRNHLAKELPDYMVPAHFVPMEALPLNPSGKVDRKALPDPDAVLTSTDLYIAPRNEIEQKVVSLWQELLKREKVGVKDDFFNLGGHSLIAIRLIARLEEGGLKVGLNDIFRYRTAEELAARIATSQSEQENERSLAEGCHLMATHFGCKIEVREFNAGGRSFSVLYTDHFSDQYSELVTFMATHFTRATLPHYIRPLEKLPSHEVELEDLGAFSHMIDLDFRLSLPEEEALIATAFERANKCSTSIESQPVRHIYPMSPIQLAHMTLSLRPAGGMLVFKDYLDLPRFARAFTKLVSEQSLLRSLPQWHFPERRAEEQWCWAELETPNSLEIPFLDLSHLAVERAEDLVLKLMGRLFFHDYESQKGGLPYHILLVRQNLKEFLMIFTADHIIYDAMSDEIIKNALMAAYYDEPEQQSIGLAPSSYESYVTQTLSGPQNITESELVEAFQLNAYHDALTDLKEVMHHRGRNELREFSLDTVLKDEALSSRTPFEVAYAVFVRFVGAYLEMDHLPLTLVSYGRRYGDSDYFGTIGEFVDQIPIYTDVTNQAFDHVRTKLDLAIKHNINFMSLMYDMPLQLRWDPTVALFARGVYTDNLIRFNFQGRGNPEEMDRMKRFVEERMPLDRPSGNEVKQLKGILFEALYFDRTLRITLNTSLDGKLARIRAMLAQIVTEEASRS